MNERAKWIRDEEWLINIQTEQYVIGWQKNSFSYESEWIRKMSDAEWNDFYEITNLLKIKSNYFWAAVYHEEAKI